MKRLAKRAQGAVLGKTFGLHFLVARDTQKAEDLAHHLLAGETPLDMEE